MKVMNRPILNSDTQIVLLRHFAPHMYQKA